MEAIFFEKNFHATPFAKNEQRGGGGKTDEKLARKCNPVRPGRSGWVIKKAASINDAAFNKMRTIIICIVALNL